MMNPLTNVKNITKLNERELALGISGKSSWHNMYKDSAWIFIGGLPYDITEGDVLSVFSQYGEIANLNLVRDKKTGKSKGFCFLCYSDQRSTILAVDNFNGIKLCGRTIRVDHVADYKPPKEDENEDEITKTLRTEGCAPKSVKMPMLEETVPVKNKKVEKEKKKKKRHRSSSSSSSVSHNEEVTNKKEIKIKKEKVNRDYDKYEIPDKYVPQVNNCDKAEFDSESGTDSPACRSSFKNCRSNKETTRIRDSYEVHSLKTSKPSAKESYCTRNNTDSHKYGQNVSRRRERNEKSSGHANDSSRISSSWHHGRGEGKCSSHKEYDRMDYRKSKSHSSSKHYRKSDCSKHGKHRENH